LNVVDTIHIFFVELKEEKAAVKAYRRAKKMAADTAVRDAVLTKGPNVKVAKHVKLYKTTAILTNGATMVRTFSVVVCQMFFCFVNFDIL
jgi:ERCC4-related helicase